MVNVFRKLHMNQKNIIDIRKSLIRKKANAKIVQKKS